MQKMKFEQWAALWLEEKRYFVKESTYANYLIVMENHLIVRLGEYEVEDISKEIVQKMIVELRTSGRIDGKGGLSEKTVKDMMAILRMCLKDFGVKENWLYRKNTLKYPVNDKFTKIEPLNEYMYQKILHAIYEERDYEAVGYAVSLYTGMRIEEVCALQWKDIDMEQQVISVTKTLQRVYLKKGSKGRTKIIIGTPKSRAAVREIPIAKSLEALLALMVTDKECYLISGTTKYIEPRLYRQHFSNFLDRNGIMHMRYHDLRHPYVKPTTKNKFTAKAEIPNYQWK